MTLRRWGMSEQYNDPTSLKSSTGLPEMKLYLFITLQVSFCIIRFTHFYYLLIFLPASNGVLC